MPGDGLRTTESLQRLTMGLSPALRDRIDALATCRGHWLLIRDGEPVRDCSHQWHQGPDDHLATCLSERWQDVSLGFVPELMGYSDYASTGLVGLSNFRTFTDPETTADPNNAILTVGYGYNGEGVVLDIRLATVDQIETVEALESYPLISDDDHSQLEFDAINADWEQESISNRVSLLQDYGLSVFAARHDDTPWRDGFDRLRDAILENANEYPAAAG